MSLDEKTAKSSYISREFGLLNDDFFDGLLYKSQLVHICMLEFKR